MRKRRSPEGARHSRQPRACWRTRLLLAGGLVIASSVGLHAQADKGLTSEREDRIEQAQVQQADQVKADAEIWSPAKIIFNLDARCPVVLTLGYFGAYAASDPDPARAAAAQARLAELQKAVQPIAAELKQMAVSTSFVGQSFPASLNPRLDALSGQLYGAVLQLYGDAGLGELKQYLAASTQGAVADHAK